MNLGLDEDQAAALIKELHGIIEGDPLPPRTRGRTRGGSRAYLAATGWSSAYISGSTVSRQVISLGKIFSIARAE